MQLTTVFFLVNLIGGFLVLSSYAWGLWSFPFHRHFFSMFLGLSSLWMPMAIQSVISNSPLWIALTKVILFFVAICSLLILFGIFNSSTLDNQILPGKYFSFIGWFFLCVQTVIFDGIFWSLKFNPH